MIAALQRSTAVFISPFSSRPPRRACAAVRCSSEEVQEASEESRRMFLRQVCLGAAACVLSTAGPANALPGFKKDLKNTRRLSIPEAQYTPGPEGLKYYDIVVGTGAEAQERARVAVHIDCKWKGVTIFTSRQGMGVTGGTPLGFDVGAAPGLGGTLKGVDLGVRGMRVGGQRRLLVPPNLAYGAKGRGEIPPDATITIDVALLSIKQSARGTMAKLVEG